MKDAIAVTGSVRALSPQIVAVHGPTGTGKSTVFPLAVAHWTYTTPGVKSVRSQDESWLESFAAVCGRVEIEGLRLQTSLLYVALIPAQKKDDVTTVIVDEVHNRSAQSDYVLALALAAAMCLEACAHT